MEEELLLREELRDLQLENPSSITLKITQDEHEKEKIREFCKKVHSAMVVNHLGYWTDGQIAMDIFDDFNIDAIVTALSFGFKSFEAFLESDWMKSYIEVDHSDGFTTYHAKNAPVTHIQRAQAISFMDMNERRSRYNQSYGMSSSTSNDHCVLDLNAISYGGIDAQELLLHRLRKREGKEVVVIPKKKEVPLEEREMAPVPIGLKRVRGGKLVMNSKYKLHDSIVCEDTEEKHEYVAPDELSPFAGFEWVDPRPSNNALRKQIFNQSTN